MSKGIECDSALRKRRLSEDDICLIAHKPCLPMLKHSKTVTLEDLSLWPSNKVGRQGTGNIITSKRALKQGPNSR